jgi:hypothetical protein
MRLRLVIAAMGCALLVAGLCSTGVADAAPIAPPPNAPVVTAGARCTAPEAGDVGATGSGSGASGLFCAKAPGDPVLRWRPLDPATHRLVGAIDRLYRAYFDRPIDSEGLAHWINQRVDGVPLVTISDSFYRSAEFSPQALDPSDFHDEGVEPYIIQAYELVLHRSEDREGYTYWFLLLRDDYFGTPRFLPDQNVRHPGLMIALLSQSAEFRAETGTA